MIEEEDVKRIQKELRRIIPQEVHFLLVMFDEESTAATGSGCPGCAKERTLEYFEENEMNHFSREIGSVN